MCSLNTPNSATGMLLSTNAFHPRPLLDHNTQVKQNASLPPAFQARPQGPPSGSPRFATNNGSSGPRLGGPQPPVLRRLDSRSSLVTGQRPFGPTSPQGQPIRPQGFPQRAPQPQLFPGQNQNYQNSPGGGPPKRFPSVSPQGQRLQTPPGPRSLVASGQQQQRPLQVNQQQPLGPNSLQYHASRPQVFPQRTPSQSSFHSDSPDGSRPGTPSSGGKLSSIFPQRQLMSGPEGLPPQTNFEASREPPRNGIPMNSDSPVQRSPMDPKISQNTAPVSMTAGIQGEKSNSEEKLGGEYVGNDKRPDSDAFGKTKAGSEAENSNGKQKPPPHTDDDDDVVIDSDSNKTGPAENFGSDASFPSKNNSPVPSKSPESFSTRTPVDFQQESHGHSPISQRTPSRESNSNIEQSRTPEPTKSPGPREAEGRVDVNREDSESPVSRKQINVPSPFPPKSLESTPGGSPQLRSERSTVNSPLANQELEERLSVSESPEASPKSLTPNIMGHDGSNARSPSSKSPIYSSSPSPNPPKSPISTSQSPNVPGSPVTGSPAPAKSPTPSSKSLNSPKSPIGTPQTPNPPKSPGCLRTVEGDKSGRSTPDGEVGKKRATFAKDLIMSGANKDDESAASTLSDVKDVELTTPEESSKGTPTTPSKGPPGTPKKSATPTTDRSRHRSRSPKSEKGKSPDKESAAARNRSARESKERSKTFANRSRKSEGDNDSGVDESTQGHEPTTNGDAGSPTKGHSKIPGPKRSTSSSPTKSPSKSAKGLPKTPDAGVATSATADKKKLPMNKIQVGAAPSPNLKTVRSKIGSLDNTSYRPGGGKVKIENRKLDFSKAQPKIAAKNDKYTPSGGDKKITQVKLQWNAKPKVGSLENSTYKPGGGDKKIETVKLDFKEKAKPKVASKDNVKHVPGGGTVKSPTTPPETPQKASDDIETLKIEVKAESKVGSMDNVKHKPGGGDKKIFNDKDYLRQTSSNVESLSGSGSQEKNGNVVLNVISPSPARRMKTLVDAEDSLTISSHSINSTSPISVNGATTPGRPKSRPEQMPVPPTTTPVEEKKPFPQSRKSSLVKTPDRSKTPEVPKKVTIAETQEMRSIETTRNPKSPTEKRPKTPEEKRPATPKHESPGSKTPDSDSKSSTPRNKSPQKKSPSEERQKSPRKKSISGETPTSAGGKGTPRKERSSPPNSLPLNNSEATDEKMRKSSSKEFRLPKIVSNMLPELTPQDPVITTTGSDSKIALPKLVETPTSSARTGVAQ
ncbi:proteoglycan 4 isoform X4 [Athalia rosae]|uniref:proteoglycan 4 isoform X4 n=1 Tax=Athalia rosae TaxID=37344 RepID=UPI0020337184|nr:proteoglycan 4 isoform X4 [Athalia rosae]